MRIVAIYAACALVSFSSLAAAQGKGPADQSVSGECLCMIPASLPVQASAGKNLTQPGGGTTAGDRVRLGRDGQVVVLPGAACDALRAKFQCRDVEDPVSP